MARIGMNPARGKDSTYRPARVTVAVLSYIPHLDGYFKNRLDILKITLSSIITNTKESHDLLVFDNGSCSEVVDYLRQLRDIGRIDYLILSSRNLGKIGAFKILFQAAPGEVIAYSDDDILFYPGWLQAHLKILETYPKVGMVSGAPVRHASSRANNSLKRFLESRNKDLDFAYEQRIPDEWSIDWAQSTGRDPEKYLQEIHGQDDLILKYRGVEAFGSASHFQFVIPKKVAEKALPSTWSGQLMGQMVTLDESVDELGVLRLSTPKRYTRHLGNTISPKIAKESQILGLKIEKTETKLKRRRHWLLRIPGSGRGLRLLYNYLFRVLHDIS